MNFERMPQAQALLAMIGGDKKDIREKLERVKDTEGLLGLLKGVHSRLGEVIAELESTQPEIREKIDGAIRNG